MYRYAYILVGRSHLMPPKQRGEELKKIVKNVRDGTFEYDSKDPVTRFSVKHELQPKRCHAGMTRSTFFKRLFFNRVVIIGNSFTESQG